MTQAPKRNSPWRSLASVPQPLETSQFVLEPLSEIHAERDFTALMSCRCRLREELQWGVWPPEDFTLELNRDDLRGHHGEFRRGEAFAYTVLSPDRSQCLGCIYLERCAEVEGAQVAFWVIDESLHLEPVLVANVLRWFHESWSINRILIPLREENTRDVTFAQNCGWTVWDSNKNGPLAQHLCFLSESTSDERDLK